jgi:hypothetical protein
MSKKKFIKNHLDWRRPFLLSDRLGYDKAYGDEKWKELKKHYVYRPNGTWERKKW